MTLSTCHICHKSFHCVYQHIRQSYCGLVVRTQYAPKENPEANEHISNVPNESRNELNQDNQHQPDYGKSDDEQYFQDNSFSLREEEEDFAHLEEEIVEDTILPPGTTTIPPSLLGCEMQYTYTCQTSGYVKLLNYVNSLQAPKYAFDELMELLRELYESKFDFGAVHPKRKTITKKLSVQFPCSSYDRIEVPLEVDPNLSSEEKQYMPSSVFVYRFDIVQQIRDLLSDDIFHSVDNLCVNATNPYGKYKPLDGRYNEINSGDWYQRTYDALIKDPENETVLALKLYCDKTGCDPMLQRHGLEPVMFTFTIIKRDVQQQCKKAWRHIGFIPDLDQRSKAESQHCSGKDERRGRPTRNYHRCLDVLLQPLYELQKTGMEISLRIGKYVKTMHAHLPVSLILGDAKSNDMWCCRVAHHDQRRMSRACYTPVEECANPNHRCRWVLQESQRRISERCGDPESHLDLELLEELKEIATVRCSSSIFQMNFGNNKYGQFIACTADAMHLFEGGWCAYVAKTFVAGMGPKVRLQLDCWLNHLNRNSKSSCRDRFPRTNFSGGITSMTLIASHEWIGVLLTYLLAIHTEKGHQILTGRLDDDDARFKRKCDAKQKKAQKKTKRLKTLSQSGLLSAGERMRMHKESGPTSSSRSNNERDSSSPSNANKDTEGTFSRCTLENVVQLFEMLLCFHAFYKKSEYWKCGDFVAQRKFDLAMRKMMRQLVTTLDRSSESELNWNMQKVHELLHFPRQISEYGSLMNSDTGVGERGLKYWAKQPARKALKHSVDVFTESTVEAILESLVLEKASEAMHFGDKTYDNYRDHRKSKVDETDPRHKQGGFHGHHRYEIIWDDDEEYECVVGVWTSKTKYKGEVFVPTIIVDLFSDQYFIKRGLSEEIKKELVIYGFTDYVLDNGKKIIAHPNYRSNGPYYDWVILEDPNKGIDHVTKDQDKILDEHKRTNIRSRVEKQYPKHVPARCLAFFANPDTHEPMAIVHPCRPWMNKNQKDSSVIVEHWNLQAYPGAFIISEDGEFIETEGNNKAAVTRLVPFYHIVPAKTIKDVVYAIQEEDLFCDSWDKNGGNALVICDRDTHWGKEFLEYK